MITTLLLTLGLTTAAQPAAAADPNTAYLMAHFTGESATGEQIYFATSTDGLHWTDLNYSQPVLLSNVGEKGVRDPSLVRSPAGDKVFLIATDLRIASGKGWDAAQHAGSTSLVVWESADLVNWSAPRLVNVAGGIAGAGCAWAPEAIYDAASGDYIVYWATISPLNGVDKARIYYSRTRDFRTFSTAQLYIDRPGSQGIIDTQIIEVAGSTGGYRYIRASGDGQISIEGSNSILSGWSRLGDISHLGLTGAQVEGPILHQFNGRNEWGLWVDQYAAGKGYLPLTTTNLASTGTYRVRGTSEYNLGASRKRHGSIMGITQAQYNTLQSRFGGNANRLQSYNFNTRYVRHANYDARIDANVSPLADSQWRIRPGLANASGYVSFESVNFPGYYLRHSNYDFALVRNDGTAQFAADATFRQVAGLADASAVSYQSYGNTSRYIRHYNYLLRLDPISTATERADATFRITS
ncbi:glycoside hydrolase family 43 protein [Catellatospora sp. KI3]|uniref:glycoside hydrolase family 43 protein n=1 Tax=Catellatospora sp. KI3 TaxID=3041620 RepID=UPI002482B131|nr:glycoside hydrolase family 43 protein [Catellatospora sp. KI3]MDI1465357.1 glycoside hydrolase family 43 protein [Catellatospora sp. KI3]